MVAADKGYQNIVEALLEGDVDVNYKHQVSYILYPNISDYCMHVFIMYMQETGWPAIFFAAKNGRVSILKMLLERGAVTKLEVGDHVNPIFNLYNT